MMVEGEMWVEKHDCQDEDDMTNWDSEDDMTYWEGNSDYWQDYTGQDEDMTYW